MRTTVGPLPATVYWRRRAVVLGAIILSALILFVSCTGGDDSSKKRPGASGPRPGSTASPTGSATPGTEPSFEDAVPGNGPSRPDPSAVGGDDEVGGGSSDTDPGGTNAGGSSADNSASGVNGSAGPGVNVPANAAGLCTDAEMSVTPVPARTTVRQGEPVDIRLKIKNVSARSCTRDVGADLQEIYIKQGAHKTWSSDTCGTAHGSELRKFPAGYEADYGVTWNGLEATRCSAGLAVGAPPPVGDFDVFGRLGGKVSAPVRLTISS